MNQESDYLRARTLMFFAVLFWSSAFVGIRYGMQIYSAGSLALLRYSIASVCMGIIFFSKKHPSRSWKQVLPVMGLGVIGFAIYNVLLNQGEQQITASIASFIMGLSPIIVAVLGKWIYGERLKPLAKWGFFISLVGVCIMVAPQLGALPKLVSLSLVFIAMLCGAFYWVMQKAMIAKMSVIEFTAYAIWGGTIAMLIFIPQLYHEILHAPSTTTLVVVYMGIFPGAIAYLFSSYGYSKLPVAQAASFSYLIPLLSTAMAFIFLDEVPAFYPLLGASIAFVGVVLVNKAREKIAIK